MAGLDVAWIPFTVMYLLYLIPPTLMEVYSYYSRGGLVRYEDLKYDDSFCPQYQWNRDTEVYYKRFLDRPTSEAGKAFFSWLDWSSESYDRTIYILRRNLAKQDGEVSPWWRYEAKAKGFNKNYHYQIMRKIRREQALKAAQVKAAIE
ncbi:hypothetical protein CGC20_33900 [Leishmania donovani]|uniref:Uncharacterized protein n=1 Tax=Leishmania donovani TaxID=5661 RepID=A0A504XHF2_LEIDO|nr:hypothetical protein CGC21_20135 [Leishmania donovani]TPP47125.1 hypothetical protein CGC20_33900 [Leishmania donovani]